MKNQKINTKMEKFNNFKKLSLLLAFMFMISASGWAQISSFPHTEGWEGGNISNWSHTTYADEDWENNTGGTTTSGTGPSSANEGNHYIYCETSGTSNGDVFAIESPNFDFTSLTNPSIMFDYHMLFDGETDGTLNLDVSTDNGSTWTTEWTKTGEQGSNWQNATASLGTYAGMSSVRLRFHFTTGTSGASFDYDAALDYIVVLDLSCPPPSNLSISNITPNSADISWTSGGASNWNLEYGPAGFTQGTGTMIMDVSNPYTLSGLTSLTDYDVYVQDSCGAGDVSLWTGPESFFTPYGLNCPSGAPDEVFTESWESGQGSWTGDIGTSNAMWQLENGATGSSNTGPSGAHDGTEYIYFEAGSSGTATMVSPAIDLSTGSSEAVFSFWMHAYGSDIPGTQLTIGVGTNSSGPFTTEYDTTFNAEVQSSSGDPYVQQYVDLTSYLGQVIYLEIEYTTSSTYEADLALDLMEVSTCISCPTPTNFSVSNITGSSVDLSWNDPGTGSTWEIEYGNAGFTLGSGTRITGSSPHTISGLNQLTDYDFYVRAICGAGDTSTWAGPETAKTLFQCPAGAFCFTNAGATGATGPTQSELDAEYAGTSLNGLATSVNGYQQWMVPQSGDYTITVYGAEGGGVDASNRGQGGKAEGTVNLTGGNNLYVAVGQAGQYGHTASTNPPGGFNGGGDGGSSQYNDYHGSSGGGASDVRIGDTTLANRLIVGAGGGGGTGDGNEAWRAGGGGGGGGGYYGGGGGHGGNESPYNPGSGATQSAGGSGGGTLSGNTDGGLGYGGHGGHTDYTSSFDSNTNQYGGDGGGLTGQDGNDGGSSSRADGGGGGSSYTGGLPAYALSNTSNQTGIREGDGLVIIDPQFTIQFAENDAEVVSIDEPDIFCPGTNDVVVTLGNPGANQITSVDVHWTINGVAQTPATYTGTLDTIGGSGNLTDQLILGSYSFTDAAYDIVVWTTNPNGQTDTVNDNDTAYTTVQSNIPAPQNLTITDFGMDFASFAWNGYLPSDEYIYVIVPAGDAPETGTPVNVTQDSATATGLTSFTALDIYVAELCPGGTDTSAWKGPETVITGGPMSGIYTIGPDPAHNFPSFNTAYSALSTFGITGAVTFEVAAGVYNETLTLDTIMGAGSSNTITFTSASGDSTDVILQSSLSSSNDAIIMFDGAQHYTFSHMTIRLDTGSSAGRMIQFENNAHYNQLLNNVIENQVSTSSSYASIYSYGEEDNYNMISNNHIKNGYYGIYWRGSGSSSPGIGTVIENNNIEGYHYYGYYGYYNDSLLIHNNTFENGSTSGSVYGYRDYYSDNSIHTNNHINIAGTGTHYGMYIRGDNIQIHNNLVNLNGSGTSTWYGIRAYYVDTAYIYHNSINLNGGSSSGRAMAVYNGEEIALKNNIFTHNGDGYALRTNSTSNIVVSDYNVFYTNGSDLAYWDATESTLSDLQTASGMDANSMEADPAYTNILTGDLTPLASVIDDMGTPISGITTDFYGNPRDASTPDVGAIEFTGYPDDLALIDAELVNGECLSANDSIYLSIHNILGSTVDFSTNSLTAQWAVSGPENSTGSITINSGTLDADSVLIVGEDGVDLSTPGDYMLSVWIEPNAVNAAAENDSLLDHYTHTINDPFYVEPKETFVYTPEDTVNLNARSQFFPAGDFLITEICHWAGTSTGEPVGGTPSFLGDDYIEITGVPGSDLSGFIFEKWDPSGSSPDVTHTFPAGTMMSPEGTFLLSTYQGTDSPANYHQVADVT
ncbi:MAG: glycine-rich protein, partial [Bacteroidales bacterium]